MVNEVREVVIIVARVEGSKPNTTENSLPREVDARLFCGSQVGGVGSLERVGVLAEAPSRYLNRGSSPKAIFLF
ncbi:hypothetical protein TNCV_1701771 [Trichonephila clavipes]|nr:hypothetical protein TNCV_1701771 [Trichonephila clavipes]